LRRDFTVELTIRHGKPLAYCLKHRQPLTSETLVREGCEGKGCRFLAFVREQYCYH
jgi:hypothetical protein